MYWFNIILSLNDYFNILELKSPYLASGPEILFWFVALIQIRFHFLMNTENPLRLWRLYLVCFPEPVRTGSLLICKKSHKTFTNVWGSIVNFCQIKSFLPLCVVCCLIYIYTSNCIKYIFSQVFIHTIRIKLSSKFPASPLVNSFSDNE